MEPNLTTKQFVNAGHFGKTNAGAKYHYGPISECWPFFNISPMQHRILLPAVFFFQQTLQLVLFRFQFPDLPFLHQPVPPPFINIKQLALRL